MPPPTPEPLPPPVFPAPYIAPLPEATTAPPLPSTAPADANLLSALRFHLLCDFSHYDLLPEAERLRCTQILAASGEAPQAHYELTQAEAAKRAQWEAMLKDRAPPAPLTAGDPRLAIRCSSDHLICWQDDSTDLGCANPSRQSLVGIGQDVELKKNLILSAGLMMDTTGCFGMFKIGLTCRW